VRVARAEQVRPQADLDQDFVGDPARLGLGAAVHHRAEGDGILHRHARVQRGIAVLEHHLHLAAQIADIDAAALAHRIAIEHQFAGIRHHQMQQEPRQRRLAATGLADHAERFALEQSERHAIHGAHHGALARALHPEMALQLARDQHRLGGAAAIAGIHIGLHLCGDAHPRTSIAPRTPSLTRLKQMEVTKIAMPGSAQPSGIDIERLAQGREHQAPVRLGRLHAEAQERQARSEQDADADEAGGIDEHRSQHIAQHVWRMMVSVPAPLARAAFDVVQVPHLRRRGFRDAAHRGGEHQAQGDDAVDHAATHRA